MARPRKPNELKSLQGTERKDRHVEALDVIKFEDINEIKALKIAGLVSASARNVFNEKANQLILNKMLSPLDLDQLVIYSNAMATLLEVAAKLKKPLSIEILDDTGKVKGYIQNPYLKIFKEYSDIVIRIGSDFGFSPVSRLKFHIDKAPEKDQLSELMQKFND